MSRTITPPTARIPIGTIEIDGKTVEVQQHPEFVRFFFDLMSRVGGVSGWSVDDLRLGPADDVVDVEGLAKAMDAQRLATEVQALREQVAELSKTDIETQIAQLREQLAAGPGMKVKRTIHDVITIATGDAEKNYTITPPLASMNALLIFNGSYNNTGAANGGGMLITSLSNINYSVGIGTTTPLNGRFTLMEFGQ